MLLLYLISWCAGLWAASQSCDLVPLDFFVDPAFGISPEPLARILMPYLTRMDRTSVQTLSFELAVERRVWFCERQMVNVEHFMRDNEKCIVNTWLVGCSADMVRFTFRQESELAYVYEAAEGHGEYRLRGCRLTLICTRAPNLY